MKGDDDDRGGDGSGAAGSDGVIVIGSYCCMGTARSCLVKLRFVGRALQAPLRRKATRAAMLEPGREACSIAVLAWDVCVSMCVCE